MKLTIDQHAVYVTTLVPHEEDMLVCLEIAEPLNARDTNGGDVMLLTFTREEAWDLIAALEGAASQVHEYRLRVRQDR